MTSVFFRCERIFLINYLDGEKNYYWLVLQCTFKKLKAEKRSEIVKKKVFFHHDNACF